MTYVLLLPFITTVWTPVVVAIIDIICVKHLYDNDDENRMLCQRKTKTNKRERANACKKNLQLKRTPLTPLDPIKCDVIKPLYGSFGSRGEGNGLPRDGPISLRRNGGGWSVWQLSVIRMYLTDDIR